MSNHTCSDRPLPTCKTSIVVTATIFTLFKANIQRWRPAAAATKEVTRPSAAPPLLWFPLFWLSFHNLPLFLYKCLSKITLKKDKYLNIYFHPWEFTNITAFGLPKYTTKGSDNELLDKLYRLLNDLNKQAEFVTMGDFIQNGCME